MPPNPDQKPETPKPVLPRAVTWRLAMARAAMAWERIWPQLWPPLALIAVFLIFSFLGIWTLLPRNVLALVIFALVIGTGFLMWRNLRRTRLPRRGEGLRRLEDDSGLKHRPLSSFDDLPAADPKDPATRALWRAHRARLAEKIKHVGVVLPRNDSACHDPYAFRLLLILALIVSLLIAGAEWGDRLRGALSPFLGPALTDDAEIDAWIEPPAYTGLPVITLTSRMKAKGASPDEVDPITVPAGATLRVRLSGFPALPDLAFQPEKGQVKDKGAVRRTDAGITGNATIGRDGQAKLSYRGRPLITWPFTVTEDAGPQITLAGQPEVTAAASINIPYTYSDDYGVEAIRVLITAVPRSDEDVLGLSETAGDSASEDRPRHWPLAGEPERRDLPAPKPGPGPHDETALENLAAHPWAGREVLMQLEAVDGAGNSAYSDEIRFRLPERIFLDPLAQALIEQRRYLAQAPANVRPVARALDALAIAPERFIQDTVAYLALRSAHYRLTHSSRPKEVREVYDMLWSTALHVEDGTLSQARQRLRQIQRRLSEALNRDAPASEIRQLMAQLREAIGQYLAELMQQADRGEAIPQADIRTLQSDDLGAMMNSIEQMATMGAHDEARQMLSQLSQILDSLRPPSSSARSGSGSGEGGEPSPQEQALTESLDDLADLISGQRGLMDETNRTIRPASADQILGDHELGNLEALIERSFGDIGGVTNPLKRALPPPENIRPETSDPARNDPDAGPRAEGPQTPSKDSFNDRFNEMLRNFPVTEGAPRNPLKIDRAPRNAPVDAETSRRLAERQDALRRQLGETVRDLAEAGIQLPDTMGAASDAMGSSREDLSGGELAASLEDQQAALDALRDGAESLARDLLARQGRDQGGQSAARRDPLGRPEGGDDGAGYFDSGSVRLPDQGELRRAREILEELRRRAGERSRPSIELDYYERLLRQF